MLKKLKERWKVNGWRLILILTTFALGGSLCGWLGRKILLLTGLEKAVAWVVIYIILVTLLWPLSVLFVSIPLGQFGFFKRYITRIIYKMSGKKLNEVTRIAIFASGAGSNARKIIEYFSTPERKDKVMIGMIVCNRPGAGVIDIARENNIPCLSIEKDQFYNGNAYLPDLKGKHIDLIVLAGFLWKLPATLVHAYPKKIINIHPALLPGYGGKGMYGKHVHEAVIANKEKQSGISIHYADELYDHGEIIFQATCDVSETDSPASLAEKIHTLEHEHYPVVIEAVLQKQNLR